ncbi:MAG: carboxypeptidase regulatory-like domain-containing protein, partial [Deltaproteobacteria bacterium]|nr:carboxypeptidase regulatory-like domain-containing protein [Deltaproteobacteria bacterium]
GLVLKLGKGCAIEGTVQNDSDGSPVEAAEILVSPHGLNGDSARVMAGGRGEFAVEGLPPGSYDVTARKAGFASDSEHGITVAEGQRFPLKLLLRTTGIVTGTVRDVSGNPVENARVWGNPAGSFGGPVLQQSALETRSGPLGIYTLTGLQAGRQTINAARDGVDMGVQQPVDVREGETAHVDLTLKGDGTVTGHVTKKDGPLPPGVSIIAVAAGGFGFGAGGFGGGDPATTKMLPDGSYQLQLPTGVYRMAAVADNSSGTGGGPPFQRQMVTVEANRTVVYDLALPEDNPDSEGFNIVVLEPGGVPAAGATIRISVGGNGPGRGFGMAMVADSNGRFTTPRARTDMPDTLLISAQNGGRTGSVTNTREQNTATVQLLPAASLHGRLDGDPPTTQFTLSMSPQTQGGPFQLNQAALQTFLGAQFDLDDVPGMPLTLGVQTSDGRTGKAQVALTPGGTASINISLSPAANVTGFIVDDANAPVPTALIQLDGVPQSHDIGPKTQDGSFAINGIAPGDHTLTAFAGARRSLKQQFHVDPGQQLALGNLILPKPKVDPGTIGVALRGDSQTVLVMQVLVGSPAEAAGVLMGDALASIDGAPVTGVSDARVRINGAPGSTVQLGLRRNGAPLSIPVVRQQ